MVKLKSNTHSVNELVNVLLSISTILQASIEQNPCGAVDFVVVVGVNFFCMLFVLFFF